MELITVWDLYWWTRLDDIKFVSSLSTIIFLLICAVYFVPVAVEWNHWTRHKKRTASLFIFSCVLSVVLIAVSTLVPSKKDAAMIYIVPKIANNEAIQKECSEVYTMAIEAIKEHLNK